MRLPPSGAVVVAAATLLGLGCAAKPPPWHPEAACRITTTVAGNKPLGERTMPAPFWLALIVRGYQPSGEVARPTRDCEGQPVEWTADACGRSVVDEPAAPVDPAALGERDVVVSPVRDGLRLVWVKTDRFSNGEALGPVALAEMGAREVVVHSVGSLRAYGQRPALRLERMGDGQVLVVESERCEEQQASGPCWREVKLLTLGKRRFLARDLNDDSGRCVGRAAFPLRVEGAVGSGAQRKTFELQSRLVFTGTALTVQEQLAVTEVPDGARSVDATAARVSRMRAERTIRLVKGSLVAEGPSLLERWMTQVGGPAPRAAASRP